MRITTVSSALTAAIRQQVPSRYRPPCRVRTDYQDNIFEYTNEDNNERASTAPAQVVLPDLVVSSVQFEHSRSVGDTLHVRAYIKNIGQGTSNGYVKTRFNAGDSWTGMGLQCNLAAGL